MSDFITRDRQTAKTTPFDSTGLDITPTPITVHEAIANSYSNASAFSKGFTFCSYTGKANTGRYMEFWSNISSDDAALYTPTPLEVLTIVMRTTASSATCTFGWYNISGGLPGTLLHTTTFSAQKEVIESASPVFTIPAGGRLAIKVNSGSISTPHIYFILKGQ